MREARYGKTSNFQLCTIINIVLLFVVLLLIARTVLLPQSFVYNAHLTQTNELKILIEETSQLLKDLSESGVNLPNNVKRDINNIQYDFPKDGTEEDKDGFLFRHGLIGSGSSTSTSTLTSRLLLQKLQQDLRNCSSEKDSLKDSLVSCNTVNQNSMNNVPTASGSTATNGEASKWLVIGIPTVARPNNEDYLLKTLAAMAAQFPDNPSDLYYHQVLVVVVNVQSPELNPNPHTRFEEARALYALTAGHPKAHYFKFIQADPHEVSLSLDLKKNAVGKDLGSANVPGKMVRKQTRDVALVLTKSVNLGKHYLFLEDDMEVCAFALTSFQYVLNKASLYHPDWLAIRASYGMNGIFMHNKDLLVFADYLRKNQVRRPPDHLVVEWFAGETAESKAYKGGRANIGFRYNLFDHLGVSSSLRAAKQSSFPRCYEKLGVPTVFAVEAFDPKACGKDDMWPCDHIAPASRTHMDWSSLNKRHY